MIAYTIGSTKVYDEELAKNPDTKKTGRYEGYEGGWVWKTAQEAYNFIVSDHIIIDGEKRDNKKFSVYQIEMPGTWDECVAKDVDEYGINLLLKDSKIIKKVRTFNVIDKKVKNENNL